jgi:hypothetical protein
VGWGFAHSIPSVCVFIDLLSLDLLLGQAAQQLRFLYYSVVKVSLLLSGKGFFTTEIRSPARNRRWVGSGFLPNAGLATPQSGDSSAERLKTVISYGAAGNRR